MPRTSRAAIQPICTAPRMAHWQTAQKFVTGREVLRVYNPNLEQHGWHSDHTVVEIVNDDMPFLVDSVTMAVNRLGLALHSAIHPVFRVWRANRARSSASARRVTGAEAAADSGGSQSALESFIHFEVDRCGEAAKLDELRDEYRRVLGDVRAAVEDWPKIVDIARATIRRDEDAGHEPGRHRSARVPRMDGRGPLHVPRPSRLRTRHAGRRVCACAAWPGSGAGILRETLRPADAATTSRRCRPRPRRSSKARRRSFSPRPIRARQCIGRAIWITSA